MFLHAGDKFTSFCHVLKNAYKRKLVLFFCFTVYKNAETRTGRLRKTGPLDRMGQKGEKYYNGCFLTCKSHGLRIFAPPASQTETKAAAKYTTPHTHNRLMALGPGDSEWQWHQLGHMQVCTSLHTDNHASTSPLSFLQAGCPSCRPTNSVKALKVRDESRK